MFSGFFGGIRETDMEDTRPHVGPGFFKKNSLFWSSLLIGIDPILLHLYDAPSFSNFFFLLKPRNSPPTQDRPRNPIALAPRALTPLRTATPPPFIPWKAFKDLGHLLLGFSHPKCITSPPLSLSHAEEIRSVNMSDGGFGGGGSGWRKGLRWGRGITER
ncbi:hypothetical protein IE53DRAFT_13012 [Violaceomyces palustris]|uniref:Uncharacterized protein n=1 Tax=Violaceomyces palustris TaxID=1673888 RepID=A0ACD0P2I3_9BASI|nr:hypothetical protein IE53DRAFT_13012 [Violaceomyces palustris]